jgi:hypothetical protein
MHPEDQAVQAAKYLNKLLDWFTYLLIAIILAFFMVRAYIISKRESKKERR